MLNTVTELFLSEYFFINAVLGKFSGNSKLFGALAKLFLIAESKVKKLFELAENSSAKDICTEKDFLKHQRIRRYAKITGDGADVNKEWEEVIRIKGEAILLASGQNLTQDLPVSRNTVYSALCNSSASGNIGALRALGFLQCEGIFLDRNKKAGLRKLKKCADWNDKVSTLALLHYCEEDRQYNFNRLIGEVEDTPFEELSAIASKKYRLTIDCAVPEVGLLNKAFYSAVLKPNVLDAKYQRILNSKALSIKDKERVILSSNAEQLSAINDLPLKLSRANIKAVDTSGFDNIAVKREEEAETIICALKNSDLRELKSYRPLCLSCDSRYLLNMYAKAISAENAGVHTERIYAGDLSEYDCEPTFNNIFVRSTDEDADNRFLLFFYGEVSERKTEFISNVLQSVKRKKFHLNSPNITLDMGAVLPLCFCDSQNEEALSKYCDVVRLAPLNEKEFCCAVEDILRSKEQAYGVGKIKLEGEVKEVLEGFDIDKACKVIDASVRAQRQKTRQIVLHRKNLLSFVKESNNPKIGFGGDTNERHR